MSKSNKYKKDLIGNAWKESTEDSFYKSGDDFGDPIGSYFDESKRDELNINKIEQLTIKALSREWARKLDAKPDDKIVDFEEKSDFIISTKGKPTYFTAIYIIAIAILAAGAYYITFHNGSVSHLQGVGIAVSVGLLIRAILNKFKPNIYAFKVNPFYIEVEKSFTNSKSNSTLFFDDIIGISFTADDFKNLDKNSKFDGIIQYLKDENTTEIPNPTLYIFYEKEGELGTLPIDFEKIDTDKLLFLRLISSLLRSDLEQRHDILSAYKHIHNNYDAELSEQVEGINQNYNNDNISDSEVEDNELTNEEGAVEENESNSLNSSFDKPNYELCFNRPGNVLFKGKKGVIRINPERIFLDYGICNEEEDIVIAFDDIIGIAYDEYEAKEGVVAKTRDLEVYLNSREDEEISIYHKQGDRFVNTKVYISKTETKRGVLFDLIILLHKHNVKQRKKIIQIHKN